MKFRIAIQNKGRLMDGSIEYLRGLGLDFEAGGLVVVCSNRNIEILFVRCGDIPTYIEQGVTDFGIVGENVLLECGSNLCVVERLGFGKCSLVIAAPAGNEDLEGERIATSYPNSLKKYLKAKRVNASVIEIGGSVEASVGLNLADAVCDIRQSGRTLKENGLDVLDVLFNSEAVLVGTSSRKWEQFKKSF